MQSYSPQQVADAMRAAGFSDAAIPTGVAIATAESGRRATAANTSGEHSYGIWQINLDFWGKPNNLLAPLSQGCVADLTCSTKAAYAISRGGTDWSAWTTFTSGSYLNFLNLSPTPIPPASSSSPSSVAGATPTTGAIPSLASRLSGNALFSAPLVGGIFNIGAKAVISVALIGLVFVGIVKVAGGSPTQVAKHAAGGKA